MKHCGCITNKGWPCAGCQTDHAFTWAKAAAAHARVLAGHDLDLYLDTRDDLARWDDPDAN